MLITLWSQQANVQVASVRGCSVQFCFLLGRFRRDDVWAEGGQEGKGGKAAEKAQSVIVS